MQDFTVKVSCNREKKVQKTLNFISVCLYAVSATFTEYLYTNYKCVCNL